MTLLEQVAEIEQLYQTYGDESRTAASAIPKLCAKLREVVEALNVVGQHQLVEAAMCPDCQLVAVATLAPMKES